MSELKNNLLPKLKRSSDEYYKKTSLKELRKELLTAIELVNMGLQIDNQTMQTLLGYLLPLYNTQKNKHK
jgi:hypothetical protein